MNECVVFPIIYLDVCVFPRPGPAPFSLPSVRSSPVGGKEWKGRLITHFVECEAAEIGKHQTRHFSMFFKRL